MQLFLIVLRVSAVSTGHPSLGRPQTEEPALLHEPHCQLLGQKQPLHLSGGGPADQDAARLPEQQQKEKVERGAGEAFLPAQLVLSLHQPCPDLFTSSITQPLLLQRPPALSHPPPEAASQPEPQPLSGRELALQFIWSFRRRSSAQSRNERSVERITRDMSGVVNPGVSDDLGCILLFAARVRHLSLSLDHSFPSSRPARQKRSSVSERYLNLLDLHTASISFHLLQ